MRYIGHILFSALLLGATVLLNAQKKDDALAKIGNIKITADEYIKRFELMPHVGINEGNLDSAKMEFLCTLVAEKLWGMEAEKAGYDTAEVMRYSYKELEKMYVRDALYKELIESKIKIPQEEIVRGVFKNEVKLKINVITSRDSSEIFSLYDALCKGASFDSVLHTRPEFDGQDSTGMEITFGQMEEYIEDVLYKLLPGAFSAPVKNKASWLIFKLRDRVQNIADASDRNKSMNEVKKILNERAANKLYGLFYDKFFLGKKVEADRLLIWSIIEKASDILIKKKKNPEYNKIENVYLASEDIDYIAKQMGADTLKMEVLQVNGRSIKIKDLLENLRFDGFYTNRFEPKIIAAKLNARIKYFIEHEMLTDEAYDKGLKNLPEVQQDIDMWKMSYLGQILKFKYKDSLNITNDDLYNYYIEKQKINKGVTQVNIREILTDSLEVIEKVLNELKAGKDFAELAKLYTKRTWTKEKGGEFGFFPVSVYGEIGSAAEKMQVGDVYGPIKLAEGYSIFKLIDRKTDEDTVKKSFEEAKADLKKEVFGKKFQGALVKKTTELAEKYGVTINEKALKNLKVENLNMYTFRYMGFGGKINAVPLPMPLYEWYDQYKKEKRDLP